VRGEEHGGGFAVAAGQVVSEDVLLRAVLIRHVSTLTVVDAARNLCFDNRRTKEDVMSRVQLALRVSDLEGSIRFYSSLFGVEPAKRRPGYANFAIAVPPLKLVLLEGEPDRPTVMDHLGVEVETTDEVDDATTRLSELGLFTLVEDDTTCCYARQDKVWVHGPGSEPWEVYTVKEDSQDFGTNGIITTMPDQATGTAEEQAGDATACCGVTACCSHDEAPTEVGVTATEAKTAAGCGCVA
jgi:catechol 2,3-dioxygenase-like lactoylglutathione lyase family enzyme